jgi:uncharacterized protein with HEPN domain
MQPDEKDAGRLWDMLTYAEEIRDSLGGTTFDEYLAHKERRLATERRLEIIGEAARNVSTTFREAHPEIPWRRIIGLRHVLAHEYGEVKQEIIFDLTRIHLPALIVRLCEIIPIPPEDTG